MEERPDSYELLNAIQRRDTKAVTAILDKGANVNTKNKFGVTPLMHAASQGGDSSIVRLLLERGADFHARDNQGKSALDFAFGKRIREWLTELVDDRYLEDEQQKADKARKEAEALFGYLAKSRGISSTICPRCRGSKYQRTGGGGVKPCGLCNASGLNPDPTNPNYR